MKKHLLVALIFAAFCNLSHAQTSSSDYKIGIRLGPTLSLNRTASESTNTSIDRNGTALKFLLGAFVDIPFKENYHFQGGVNFASKRTAITLESTAIANSAPLSQAFDHEFLQIPLLLKLYTNEVLLDTKVFFNFGLVPEVRLNTDNSGQANPFIEDFQDFDLAGNFGGGVEKGIGVNTKVFVGLSYYLGFIDQVKAKNDLYDDFQVKSNLFSLEFGIKF